MANNSKNWNDTSPAAPSGKTNVKFQAATPNSDPTVVRDVSAYVDSIIETQLSFSDVTTANASTSQHGLVPKLPNDATKYYDGTGNFSVPAGGGGGGGGSGTVLYAASNTSLSDWTLFGTNPTLVTTQGAAIQISDHGGMSQDLSRVLSTFEGCDIEFDVFWYSISINLFNVDFGCNSSGVGPALRVDGRGSSSDQCGFASATSFSAVTSVDATNLALDYGRSMYQHIKISVSADGSTATWYLNGVAQQTARAITLNGTYLAFNGDGGNAGAYIRNITVTQR